MNKKKIIFWRHSFRNKLIKEICIEYMSLFIADASVFSFTLKSVQVCFPLFLCLFFYICTCFGFWIAISLVFREKWFVKTWTRVAKHESRIAIWNPVLVTILSPVFVSPSLAEILGISNKVTWFHAWLK